MFPPAALHPVLGAHQKITTRTLTPLVLLLDTTTQATGQHHRDDFYDGFYHTLSSQTLITRHVQELITDHWMRAQSLSDQWANFSDRTGASTHDPITSTACAATAIILCYLTARLANSTSYSLKGTLVLTHTFHHPYVLVSDKVLS